MAYARNKKASQMIMSGKTSPVFGTIQIYLGLFYEAISNDSNTRNVFNALTESSIVHLMQASKILAFWFIYSLDLQKTKGKRFIDLDETKKDFSDIWNAHVSEVEGFTILLDNAENKLMTVWNVFISNLNTNDVDSLRHSFVFAMVHLRNAQTDHLEKALIALADMSKV